MRFKSILLSFFIFVSCCCVPLTIDSFAPIEEETNRVDDCPGTINSPIYSDYGGIVAKYRHSQKGECNQKFKEAFKKFIFPAYSVNYDLGTIEDCRKMKEFIKNFNYSQISENYFNNSSIKKFEDNTYQCLLYFSRATSNNELMEMTSILVLREKFVLSTGKLIESFQSISPCDKSEDLEILKAGIGGFFAVLAGITAFVFPEVAGIIGILGMVISWVVVPGNCEMDLKSFNQFTRSVGNMYKIISDQEFFNFSVNETVFVRTGRAFSFYGGYEQLYTLLPWFNVTGQVLPLTKEYTKQSYPIWNFDQWVCKATSIKYGWFDNNTAIATCSITD